MVARYAVTIQLALSKPWSWSTMETNDVLTMVVSRDESSRPMHILFNGGAVSKVCSNDGLLWVGRKKKERKENSITLQSMREASIPYERPFLVMHLVYCLSYWLYYLGCC